MHSDQNTELARRLAHLLADTVTAKFIFHGYHWNVLGPDFGEYHKFFKTLYKDVDSSIDPLGENILKAGFPAPYFLTDYIEMSRIKEERLDGTSPMALLQSAKRINDELVHSLFGAFKQAEVCNEQGLMDFLAGRIDTHKTFNWQINAFLGVR
jgi:starvation-inducible DNA-binding protein